MPESREEIVDPPPRPFRELASVPAPLAIPLPLAGLVALAAVGGATAGALTGQSGPERLTRAIFLGSAYCYLVVSLADFAEHFRLEKKITGRYTSSVALPLGESINHGMTIATLAALFTLARPLPATLEPRDWFTLAAPGIFLALGWRDEIVYHRRRCAHREDMLHTVAHLAAGVMMGTFLATRLVFSRG